MRYIAISLLLANAAFFAWTRYQTQPQAPEPASRPLLNTGLTLLSEYDRQQSQNAGNSGRLCTVVAGFSSTEEAGEFIEVARAQNFGTYLHFADSEELLQYRVYLAPTPSREIAALTLEDLSERLSAAALDIETDLITGGEMENAIELGVYGSAREAIQVQDQISSLGYSPQVEQTGQTQEEIQVWLRSSDSDRVNQPEWLDLTGERLQLTRTEILCQTIAQASQFQ